MTPRKAGTAIALRTYGAALLLDTVATSALPSRPPKRCDVSVVQVVVLDGSGGGLRR